MPRTKYKKKIKNGNSYYFCRFRHKNLRQPKDLYGKTVLELDEKIDQLKFALDRGVTSSKASFGDYMKRWLDTVQSINKKTGTIQGYYTTFNTYIIGSPLHDIRIQEVTALDVQEYFEYLMHDHTEIVDGKPQLIKGKSINVIQSIKKLICPCIRYAFANQKILVDFSQSITV
ncbi:MAG: site-specific integrase, partial [Eubacterium sp.]